MLSRSLFPSATTVPPRCGSSVVAPCSPLRSPHAAVRATSTSELRSQLNRGISTTPSRFGGEQKTMCGAGVSLSRCVCCNAPDDAADKCREAARGFAPGRHHLFMRQWRGTDAGGGVRDERYAEHARATRACNDHFGYRAHPNGIGAHALEHADLRGRF